MVNMAVSNKRAKLNESDLFNTIGDLIPTKTMDDGVLAALRAKSNVT